MDRNLKCHFSHPLPSFKTTVQYPRSADCVVMFFVASQISLPHSCASQLQQCVSVARFITSSLDAPIRHRNCRCLLPLINCITSKRRFRWSTTLDLISVFAHNLVALSLCHHAQFDLTLKWRGRVHCNPRI